MTLAESISKKRAKKSRFSYENMYFDNFTIDKKFNNNKQFLIHLVFSIFHLDLS